MNGLRLVFPSKEYEEQAFEYIEEFRLHNSHINGSGALYRYDNYNSWLDKLKNDLDVANMPEDKVPSHTYFLIKEPEDKIIGMINIRHKLNDFLLLKGGHIGYSIRPTKRNKGYGKQILALGLEKCKELGINKVLVICNKENLNSAKVIKNNGGILEDEISREDGVFQRYWIDLKEMGM